MYVAVHVLPAALKSAPVCPTPSPYVVEVAMRLMGVRVVVVVMGKPL